MKWVKLLVRFSIFGISSYFLFVFSIAYFWGINIFSDTYVLLLEFCLAVFCSVQGKYHCKFAKFTAWGIFISDTITTLDGKLNFLSVEAACLIPALILSLSLLTAFVLSISHFVKVKRLKRKRNGFNGKRQG